MIIKSSSNNGCIYSLLLNTYLYFTALHPLVAASELSSNLCATLPESLDKTISYSCQSKLCNISNGYVPENAVASIRCKPNYHPEKKTPSSSTCLNKTWVPPIEDCFKKCDRLNPVNVNLRCIRKGADVVCDENSLLAGTIVRPSCKHFHTYKDMVPNYLEITCGEDGKWDRSLFSCIPECGQQYTNTTHVFESPWHTAIYNAKKVLICSGTIINPYLILTAAHCFQENDILINNTSNYEVVVSKSTRNYNTRDNNEQKSFKIKEIRVSSKGYFGQTDHYSSDIAAVILEEKLTISGTVLPACVDWIKIYPAEGTPAKISAWGLNERGMMNEKLTVADVYFISRQRCSSIMPNDFKRFITFDKFCASVEDGLSIIQGNGGAGLVFLEASFYYLRGILSFKQLTTSAVATFTDLADHIQWISSVYNETENGPTLLLKKVTPESSGEDICNSYEVSNCVKIDDCLWADTLISIKKAIFCGYDSDDTERICCTARNPSQVSPSVDTAQIPPPVTAMPQNRTMVTKNSLSIASANCERYSKSAKCYFNDEPAINMMKLAPSGEYPHIVIIGCGSDLKNVHGCLIGSLISETFILSVPPKDANIVTKWALLGNLKFDSSKPYSRDNKLYTIEKRYVHSNNASLRNNIALYKLQTPVVISSSIRPACLYNPNFNQINRKFRTTSWGNSRIFGASNAAPNLFKTMVTVIDDQLCLNTFEKGSYDPNSMTCVSNLANTDALSLVTRGSPLMTSTGSKSCMWTIFAIFSEMNETFKSCEDSKKSNPFVYTKVSYHLDWIQNIVWP